MNISIDFNNMESKEIDFDVGKYKKMLEEECFLIKGIFKKGTSNGLFEDNLWVLSKDTVDNYVYLDFSDIKQLTFKGFDRTDLEILKSWFVERIKNRDTTSNVRVELSTIKQFLIESDFFSEENIDNQNGWFVNDFIEDLECSDSTKNEKITTLKEYLHFAIKKGYGNIVSKKKYLDELSIYTFSEADEQNIRQFPSSRNILLLGYYIDTFFENDDSDLTTFYMPILLWWKITNVIPMRPSEIFRHTYRHCLIQNGDKWYLKINRVKVTESSDKRSLPILNKFEISESIAKLIKNYIDKTEPFGYSETLISYAAHKALNESIFNYKYNYCKIVEERYSSSIFSRLLRSFYREIILKKYNVDLTYNMVLPGDTRHFAILSLVLQGVSRIETALLSGHTSLRSQEHYYSNISYYVDSEVYRLIYDRIRTIDKTESYNNFKTIKEVIMDMPKYPPKPLDIAIPLKVGYCMCDFTNSKESCESIRCYKCSKWWCEPTNENYTAKLNLVIDEHYSKTKEKLQFKTSEFIDLLKTSHLQVFNNVITENTYNYELIQTSSKSIKYLCEDLVNTKFEMIDFNHLKRYINNVIGEIQYICELDSKE